LVERGEGVTLEELESLYPFPLDPFQREAIRALLKGESVVVAAPTSSGKTLVGEAAAIAMLTKRKKLIYTTPLKALSNQKMLEFQDRVGASRVGLRTGDTALQLESEVVVMTTEILRNMLYNLDDARWQEVGAINQPCNLGSV
jgi:superfamily II RNA helicase